MNDYKYNIDELIINSDLEMSISGWILSDHPYEIRMVIDNEKIFPIRTRNIERKDVVDKFKVAELMCGFKDTIKIENLSFSEVKIEIIHQGGQATLLKRKVDQVMYDSKFIQYHMDSVILEKDRVVIQGWTFCKDGRVPTVKVIGVSEYTINVKERVDVYNEYSDILELRDVGFEIIIKRPFSGRIQIEYSVGTYSVIEKVNIGRLKNQRTKQRLKKIIALVKMCNVAKVKKGLSYLRKFGYKEFVGKLRSTLNKNTDYSEWMLDYLSKMDLEEQRKHVFKYQPLISIVVPTYNTPKTFLIEMIESVINQSYPNWELCIADGNSQTPDTIRILEEYMAKDNRIKVEFLQENLGIADNTNACLNLATGEYIGLFDHDDLLMPNALFEVVKVLNEDLTIDFIYSDEDKIDEHGTEFFEPHFKPDWSPDTLRSYNYICHFTVFRANLLEVVGGFRKEYDGSQDYDMFLRLTECTQNIYHIPKILYHWRVHRNSTAASLGAKEYTVVAARKALQAHLDRKGIDGVIEPGLIKGTHRVKYDIKGNPKVSIIIPTKDHIDDLRKCIDSIRKSTYLNYEIIIVENNSEKAETFAYYDTLKKFSNIKIVIWENEFNYSAINNYGVGSATGEYIVLLNNDIELITPNWIQEMLMHCQREEVGIVGAKLYYPDDTIQHAGVIIGIGGVAGHSHKYYSRNDNGYFSRLKIIQNLSAVTAACLMVRKDVFDSVGGLDEMFKVAFNDVDFCLRVRETGKLVIFTPYVEAYHYESKSRGAEDTPEKAKRFEGEVKRFYDRWGQYRRDPYYNENLTLEKEDFSINI